MKKNFKILTMTLAVALIIGAAIGISASAETTAPEIISQNVEYGGNYALLYAVKADSVVGDSVSIAVYDNAECKGEALFTDSIETKAENTENVQGVSCYVFTTNGIAAKNMDTQYYIKVSADNGETVKRYSVAEYLYERLYKNGIAYSTDAGDVKRAELYNTILLYGKQAQDVLYNLNDKTEDDRTTFVTDMKYVYVADGKATIDGTFSSGIVLGGSEITLTSANTVKAWNLYDLTSGKLIKTIAPDEAFTVNTHVKVEEFVEYRGSGTYANGANTITYDGKTFADISGITHVGSGIDASVVNVGGNDAAKFSVTWSGHAYDRYSIARTGTSNNFVFETDVMIPEYNSALNFYIMPTSNLSAAASVYRGYIHFRYDTNTGKNYITLTTEGSNAISTDPNTWYYLTPGEWANVRVEYDGTAGGDLFRLTVNGQLVYEVPLNNSIFGFKGFQLQFSGTYVGTIYFDNTYLGDK